MAFFIISLVVLFVSSFTLDEVKKAIDNVKE